MVGHVHLMLNVYEDIQEIIISMGMNIVVAIGFYLDYKQTIKKENGYDGNLELTAADWESVAKQYLAIVEKETGAPFPQDPSNHLLNSHSQPIEENHCQSHLREFPAVFAADGLLFQDLKWSCAPKSVSSSGFHP